MPDATTFALFALACLAFLAIPGPSVFYIVTRSIVQGRRAGMTSMFGVQGGGLVHVVAAAFGVSALIASSATAFTIVKYAGAAYLALLGVRKLMRARRRGGGSSPYPALDRPSCSAQGVVVNVLNPKTALFFLAFLPQFVDRTRPGRAADARARDAAREPRRAQRRHLRSARRRRRQQAAQRGETRRRLEKISGGVFVALGLAAAFAGEPKRS